jgi:prevent-host-death family protein
MRIIGIRELKGSLHQTLRDVGRGELVRVTSRGRPIADIVPAGAATPDDRLSTLVAAGRVTPPARSRPSRPPRLARADRSASALVLEERDAER